MEQSQPLRFFNRGPSPAVRLVFFALLSLLLLFVDVRYRYLESIRSGLSVLLYPLQRLVTAPSKLWHEVDDFFVSHNSLIRDNAELRNQHTLDIAQLLQLQVLKAENHHLRNLLMVQQRADYPMQLAEIMYVERDIFNRKILLDKGTQANVLAGQIVMDDSGIVGQVTRVYPWMSEVTLITDKDHAVPVQVLRNGLRAVVFGSGDTGELALRYMPISSDIQNGDVLVTSGIDGTYPPGLPVAKVIHVERDPAYPFARILCTPIAGVDKRRQLLILSALLKLPERPEVVVETATDKSKNGKRGGR
ncbi:rod shape-determining protein MreC [Candidatus Nitrotoga arctica]|uniref:Cell shape-determining protein MreC n=1 Tax=Candidatus Nitrotoga arctica TaxID=453162 RepID=A0ABM8YVW2_9PROT|nr:rod shape-determining protein MreC [Candidatus Nitrotoga arctica]CAG9931568.1 Cell shape-determining protein MreC [Candidatus Nitrotoga arctica]